jgi:mediator of replication checkpoint protein 1
MASQTPTQRSRLARTPSFQREPLATLMYTPSQSQEKEKNENDEEDDGDQPVLRLGRIRRRSVTPEPNLATAKPNAFDALRAGAHKHEKEKEKKELLAKKSEFVEAEAVESDDDDGFFGGGRAKNDDDEDIDGDDQDQTLAELVDDQHMSEDALNREGVLEKHQEMEAEADAAIEKHAKEVVAGLHRRKRRNRGLGMDSDDEYEEDDLADERRRAKMARKRKINDDTLEDLGAFLYLHFLTPR